MFVRLADHVLVQPARAIHPAFSNQHGRLLPASDVRLPIEQMKKQASRVCGTKLACLAEETCDEAFEAKRASSNGTGNLARRETLGIDDLL